MLGRIKTILPDKVSELEKQEGLQAAIRSFSPLDIKDMVIEHIPGTYATISYVDSSVSALGSSLTTYIDDSVAGLASETYVDTAVLGLASETYVDNAVTGMATTVYVDSAVSGLASTTYVDSSVNGLASETYVDNSVSGLATTVYVDNAVTGLATTVYVDNAVTGLATTVYVDSAVSGLASTTYVDNAVASVAIDWGQTQTSSVADSASAVAYDFDTLNALSLGKFASFKVNGTEVFGFDADGALQIQAVVPRIQIGDTQEAYIDFSTSNAYKSLTFRRGTTPVFSVSGYYVTAYKPIMSKTPTGDQPAPDLTVQAAHARYNASFNTDGANLILMGGNSRTTGDGNAGDVIIRSGTPNGSGLNGDFIVEDMPEADPNKTGALWSDGGVIVQSGSTAPVGGGGGTEPYFNTDVSAINATILNDVDVSLDGYELQGITSIELPPEAGLPSAIVINSQDFRSLEFTVPAGGTAGEYDITFNYNGGSKVISGFNLTAALVQVPSNAGAYPWQNITANVITGTGTLEGTTDTPTTLNKGATFGSALAGEDFLLEITLQGSYTSGGQMGVSETYTGANHTDNVHAINWYGNIRIYENGSQRTGNAGSVTIGSVYGIRRSNGVVTYEKDGSTIYTSPAPNNNAVFVDISLANSLELENISFTIG